MNETITNLEDATKHALCVMCGKPTEHLADDDNEYQCENCALEEDIHRYERQIERALGLD